MKRNTTYKNLFTGILILIVSISKINNSFAQLQQQWIKKTAISFKQQTAVPNSLSYSNSEIINEGLNTYIHEQRTLNYVAAPWTLDKCYEMALEKNGTVKQQQNNTRTAVLDKKIAQYSLLPSLSYNMGHYFSFGKNIDPVTNAFSFESFSGGYTALGIELDLFAGFKKINSIKEKKSLIKASEYNNKKVELELLTNLTLTYSRLLLCKEELTQKRNVIDNIVKELDIINEKIKVGRLSKYEFYAFNARLNTEQADFITLQNDSLNTIQDLKQLMNISYKEKIDIATIDETALQNIYMTDFPEASLVESVLSAHPSIKQAEKIEQAARTQLKIARSNFLPSLFVAGNLVSNYNSDQKDIAGGKISLASQLNNNLGKNINIGLSIPIFSQMENVNLVKKQRIQISNSQLETENVKNSVTTELLHLINDFNSAKEKYKATSSALEQNKLSYNLYLEKYRLGQVSSVELITAQDILNTSTSKYLEARLQLYFQFQLLELLKKYSAEYQD